MMPAAASVMTVDVMILHEFAERGLWCDRCSLPSVIRVPYRIVMPKSLKVVGKGKIEMCQDCGEYRRAR